MAAAAEAARRLGFPFTLTARAENQIRGNPDLDDTIGRLGVRAGRRRRALRARAARRRGGPRVCEAVAKPVNVLGRPGMSVADAVAAGAQRISVGGGLAWAAVKGLVAAAEELRDGGSFEGRRRPRLGEWLAR